MYLRCSIGALKAALAVGVNSTSIAAQEIGVTSATTFLATGTPPKRQRRILEVGTDMVAQ